MNIELEFVDKTETVIHENRLIYDQVIPIPAVGDFVFVSSKTRRVNSRLFIYLQNASGMKVSFSVEDPSAS